MMLGKADRKRVAESCPAAKTSSKLSGFGFLLQAQLLTYHDNSKGRPESFATILYTAKCRTSGRCSPQCLFRTQHQQDTCIGISTDNELRILRSQHTRGHGLLRIPLRVFTVTQGCGKAASRASFMEIFQRLLSAAIRGCKDCIASSCCAVRANVDIESCF